jgi:hypothetical protein
LATGPIGFVKRSLENKLYGELSGQGLKFVGNVQGQRFGLNHARPGDQQQRTDFAHAIRADGDGIIRCEVVKHVIF